MGYHIDDLLKSDPKSQVQWLRLIKHWSEIGKTWKVFFLLRWNRDNEKFIKSCSDSSGLSLQRKRLCLQQQTSARFNNSEVFLVKFLEMVRSIEIPWVHVMSTNYNKSVSDFHQFPIWGRFYVLSVLKGNTFPQFSIKDTFCLVSYSKRILSLREPPPPCMDVSYK